MGSGVVWGCGGDVGFEGNWLESLANWKVSFGDANGGADLYTKATLVGPVEELFRWKGTMCCQSVQLYSHALVDVDISF